MSDFKLTKDQFASRSPGRLWSLSLDGNQEVVENKKRSFRNGPESRSTVYNSQDLPANAEVRDVGSIPGSWRSLEEGMQPIPVFLPGESYGPKNLES